MGNQGNKTISSYQKLDSVWLKAAVVGGLWASVEIIIGSFFHNLRIPFSGSILAANGTILLIAFYHLWPEKGLIWRAGLITALMKSISPSAVILGPMIGILSEALILEFFIRFFGSNLLSLSIAGALSVASAFLHKIVSLLLLYWMDLVELYKNIFHFAAKQIRMESASPWVLIFILLSFYVVIGIAAALLGKSIGKRSQKLKIRTQGYKLLEVETNNILVVNKKQKFNLGLFYLQFLIIPIGLVLINYLPMQYATLFVVVYSGLSIFWYKRSLRRLWKPIFWVQLLVLTLFSGIFSKGFYSTGTLFTVDGFLIGFGMTIRAIFVVIAFSSFSVELRNPLIKDFLIKKGFQNIYLALGLSFAALPLMIEAMPNPKYFLRHPIESFSNMMACAGEWLEVFTRNQSNISQ